MELKLYLAEVTDIDDEDKEGKVQIRINPQLEGVEDDLLPWAVPFTCKCSDSSISMCLPKKGSTIRVLVDESWKRFYYLGNAYFYGLFDYSEVETKLSLITDTFDNVYSNITFELYEDGGLSFHNTSDGSHGYMSPVGSYFMIDGDGNIVSKVDTSARISIGNGVYNLGSMLEELVTDLSQLTTSGSPSTHTSPTLTSQMNILLPKIKAVFKTN